MAPGILYCFNTVGDSRIYKAGRTEQPSLGHRLRSYLGPSRPRVLIATRPVADAVAAERWVLDLLRVCRGLRPREDLGSEWFEAEEGTEEEQLRRTVGLLFDAAQAAADRPPTECPPASCPSVPCLPPPCHTEDRSSADMRSYLDALESYMRSSATPEVLCSVNRLVEAFESDEACPVFPQFCRWHLEARRKAVSRRFPHHL